MARVGPDCRRVYQAHDTVHFGSAPAGASGKKQDLNLKGHIRRGRRAGSDGARVRASEETHLMSGVCSLGS